MATGVYTGSFDPITLGHLNLIKRASKIFDEVIVCIMVNTEKSPLFTLEERRRQVELVTERFPNVRVDVSNQLVAEYCKQLDHAVIVRGLRALSDFDKEFQMALINKKMNPDLDTVFFTSSEKYTYLSSTAVKEMARFGAPLTEFMPKEIIDEVEERIKARR